jgi:hypothetical protein
MEKAGVLERRKNTIGRETFGPLNKLMRHRASGIPVDLFCEPSLPDWWRSLVTEGRRNSTCPVRRRQTWHQCSRLRDRRPTCEATQCLR